MEKDIESYIKNQVDAMGGLFLKWVCPGNDGVPDRLVLLPNGRIIFVELKDDHGQVRPLQKYWLNRLFELGQTALVVKGMKQARLFVDLIRKEAEGDLS